MNGLQPGRSKSDPKIPPETRRPNRTAAARLVGLVSALLIAGTFQAAAQTLERATISKGGAVLADGSLLIIGQPFAGTMTSADFTLEVGAVPFLTGTVVAPTCPQSSVPQTDVFGAKNRYLSILAGDAGQRQAIRVTFVDLVAPYDTWNGVPMWVQNPEEICENSGQREPPAGGCASPGTTFLAATLGCEPVYRQWKALGTIDVYHEGIIPGGVYDVQVIDEVCDRSSEVDFSGALELLTPTWGDCCGQFDGTGYPAPDTNVGITTDILAMINKFSNGPTSPGKARVDLEPKEVDQIINIADVVFGLDGFRGLPYPPAAFGPPGPVPCSSGAVSSTTLDSVESADERSIRPWVQR